MWVPELKFKSSRSVASTLAHRAILVVSKDASLIKLLDYQRSIQHFKEITGMAKQWCCKINQEYNSFSSTTNKKLNSYQNEIAKTVNGCFCCTEGVRFLRSFSRNEQNRMLPIAQAMGDRESSSLALPISEFSIASLSILQCACSRSNTQVSRVAVRNGRWLELKG